MQNTWRPGANAQLISRYNYASDGLGRRSSVVNSGAAFGGTGNERLSLWQYNPRNELMLSDRHQGTNPDAPGAAVAAEHFSFGFDAILDTVARRQGQVGNRTTYTPGTLAPLTYGRNELNQYLAADRTGGRTVSRERYEYDEDGNLTASSVAGDMNCDGTVSFTDSNLFASAIAMGRTWWEQQYPNCPFENADVNGDGAVNFGDMNPFSMLQASGNAAVAKTYVWDAENRLVHVGPTDGTRVLTGSQRATFAYDYLGRRVQRQVETYAGTYPNGQWNLTEVRQFVWDGWRMLAELNCPSGDCGAGTTVARKFTWGLDLAGQMGSVNSLEDAGAIGGLLAVADNNGTPTNPRDDLTYVYLYDGNGNVGQVADPNVPRASAAIRAKYDYDPYGVNLLDPNDAVQSGWYAATNPFCFSTKYLDPETGLGYWGYRYYNAGLGRWVNRDPAGERDSANVHVYVQNEPMTHTDSLGLWGTDVHFQKTYWWAKAVGYPDPAAGTVAEADEAVDHGPLNPFPGVGDQSYHFNWPRSGADTRLEHFFEHFRRAVAACNWKRLQRDDPDGAARELGTGLHPLQDYVAHGDHGSFSTGPITIPHNYFSPQTPLPGKPPVNGGLRTYPDDPDLDAVGGPDGRPAGSAIKPLLVTGPLGLEVTDFAVYDFGPRRLAMTMRTTKLRLDLFRDEIARIAGCKCCAYFGLAQSSDNRAP